MAEITYNIYEIEPNGLSGFKALPPEDIDLITSTEVSKTFKPNDNFIELSFFTLDNTRLETISTYDRYSILSGDKKDGLDGNSEIGIDVQGDYLAYGYGSTEGKVLYNFLDYPYSNTALPQDFYIESISTDRTELRLVSVNLDSSTVLDTTNEIKTQFDGAAYIPDFHLYFGNNIFFTIVNIDSKAFRETTAVLVKLLEPLPRTIGVKATLNIVEKVSDSIAYEINTVVTPDKEVVPTLRGANFAIDLDAQATEPSQYFNYNELFSFASYNSYREINSLFNEKGAELGIDYSDFANFINFSSAEERLRNFRYKLQLLESYQTQLDVIQGSDPDLATSTPPLGYTGTGVTGTTEYWKSLIEGIINNFDHYERHLFYENDDSAWPKLVSSTTSTSKPHINLSSTDAGALAWYNAELQDAILFDAQNGDLLRNTVPSYLIEDPDNRPYELIVHMVAQHFDNIWIYTNQVSEKYDADNRLDRGASKDLIEELLKNFGVKLYTSNKSVEDLFRYFTTNSYDRGNESISSITTATGQESVSQNDYQKEIYKRIYHNLPLLMKSKGTERGLRALINCFGIPSDVLKVRVFGGESSEEFPFFGGQQAITGSIDKVRLNNTGSIVPGDTVSFYTSVIKQNNEYTPDLHRIEVGFSPAYNINEYIVSQSAVLFPNTPFDIDNYIGDPRGYETNKYPPLYEYAETILYNIDAYNLKDFVRLIKFFDNVLFRMIRDFTPARAVTDAGVIIKPHLLDRSKFKSPEITWTRPEYSGSIDTAFISGSNAGAFKSTGVGSVDEESLVGYTRYTQTPFGLKKRRISNFGANQVEKTFEEAKFDGEFANSGIRVTNGELNEDNPFKNLEYPDIRYNIEFLNQIPDFVCIINRPQNGNDFGDYIIATVPQTLNLPGSDIFYGDTPSAYTFTVDQAAPNQGDGINHEFTGDQYDVFLVTATHESHPSITNSITSTEGCEETRTVRIVKCEISPTSGEVGGTVPTTVTQDQPYNLYAWFYPPNFDLNQDNQTNTHLNFYVNNVFIGSVIEGESFTADGQLGTQGLVGTHPRSYTFTNIDPGTTFIRVTVRDVFDNECQLSVEPSFDSCPLVAQHADIDDDNRTTILLGNSLPNLWSRPYGFVGTTPTTKFYFRLLVKRKIRLGSETVEYIYGPGPFPNADPELLPLAGQSQLVNESSWTEIPYNPNGSIFLNSLPSAYFASQDRPGLISTDIYDGLFPEAEPKNANGETPPPPNVTGGGNSNEIYYARFIQFLAVSNEECRLLGPLYEIIAGEASRIPVTMYVDAQTYFNLTGLGTAAQNNSFNPGPICSIGYPALDSNEAIVYVNAPAGVDNITQGNVIQQKIPIFATGNPNDSTPAPNGMYGAWVGGNTSAAYMQTRHWAFYGPDQTAGWMSETLDLAGNNWDFQDALTLQAGNPGLVICHGYNGQISSAGLNTGGDNPGDDEESGVGGNTGQGAQTGIYIK